MNESVQYTIERSGDYCRLVQSDATELARLQFDRRPWWNLLLVSIVGFFAFIGSAIIASLLWAFVFNPYGPISFWYGAATFITALYVGLLYWFSGTLSFWVLELATRTTKQEP